MAAWQIFAAIPEDGPCTVVGGGSHAAFVEAQIIQIQSILDIAQRRRPLMDRELMRTSVTVDEAVAILLGWADEPTEFRPLNDNLSQEEQEIHDSLTYSLQEDLANDKEQAESDLAEAKYDKMDEGVIEAALQAVRKATADRALARTYLCAIEDEINKRAMSALRIDDKRTNSHQTYITLTSFDAWAEEKGYRKQILVPVPTIIQPSVGADAENTGLGVVEKKPRQRRFDALAAEINEILLKEPDLTASQVMGKLRSQIGNNDSIVIGNVGNGVKWVDNKGKEKELTIGALTERIRGWRKREIQG